MKNLMLKIQSKFLSLTKLTKEDKEKGATMVEYAIMVALIAVVSIVVIQGLGKEVSQVFAAVSTSMSGAANG